MIKYIGTAFNQFDTKASGNAYAGATVTVRDTRTGTKAELRNDEGDTLNNPLKAQNDGSFEFFTVSGLYNIIFNEGQTDEKIEKEIQIGKPESSVVNLAQDVQSCFAKLGDVISVSEQDGARYQCFEGQSLAPGDINTNNNRFFRPLKKLSTKVFTIPTDFPDIQTAIDVLSGAYTFGRGIEVVLNLKAGYRLITGTALSNGDFSHFRITADDSIVLLSPNFSPVDSSEVAESNRAMFYFKNCKTPVLDCLIDAQGLNGYDFDGWVGFAGTQTYIERGAGIRDARYNLLMRGNTMCYAKGTEWEKAGRNTVRFTENSQFVISESNVGRGWELANEGGPSDASIHVSRSSMGQAQAIVANNNGYSAITVRRSWVYLLNASFGSVGNNGGASTNICVRPFDGSNIILSNTTFLGNPVTPSNCNVAGFNFSTDDGIVYEPSYPGVIDDIESDNGTERTIKFYDNLRVTQIKLPNFSLDDPDISVDIDGYDDNFIDARICPAGSNAWMSGGGFTNRLAAVNALVVSATNQQVRIRQSGSPATGENLDMVLTVIGHPA